MNSYQYIWDPIKKKNININSQQGMVMIKKYITTLSGGGSYKKNTLKRLQFLKNPLTNRFEKIPRPKCINYFITKKIGKKTKKVFKFLSKGKYDYSRPCPDSLLKMHSGNVNRDSAGLFIPEDWDADSPLSIKSIINKDYKCKPGKKNKRKCSQIHRKSQKCVKCLDNKINIISYQIETEGRDKKWIKKHKKIQNKMSELKQYLESINSDNNEVLKNK